MPSSWSSASFSSARVECRLGRKAAGRRLLSFLLRRRRLLLSYSRSSSSPTPVPSSTCSWRSGFPCMHGDPITAPSLNLTIRPHLRPRSRRTASGSACRLPSCEKSRLRALSRVAPPVVLQAHALRAPADPQHEADRRPQDEPFASLRTPFGFVSLRRVEANLEIDRKSQTKKRGRGGGLSCSLSTCGCSHG